MVQYSIYSETTKDALERLLISYFERSGDNFFPFQLISEQCHINFAYAESYRADLARYGAPKNYRPNSILAMDVYDRAHTKHIDKVPAGAHLKLDSFWNALRNPIAFEQITYKKPLKLEEL